MVCAKKTLGPLWLSITRMSLLLGAVAWTVGGSESLAGVRQTATVDATPHRNVLIEVYVRDGQSESDAARAAAEKIAQARPGLQVVVRDINDNPEAEGKLKKIAEFFHFDAGSTPVIYGCGQVIREGKSAEEFETSIGNMLKLEVFTQDSCPHCDTAHTYLDEFSKQYPALQVVYRSISSDLSARNDLNKLITDLRTAAPYTPVFHVCNQLLAGFEHPQTSLDSLRQILKKWTVEENPAATKVDRNADLEPASAAGTHRFTTIE